MSAPIVWYMAQGYPWRGGHEAHILHYATELRKHGFNTGVVVPDSLPRNEHLFMSLLRERGIPLESLADGVRLKVAVAFRLLVVPWCLLQVLRGAESSPHAFRSYLSSRFAARALERKISRESPDLIHIFGRLADNLWNRIPPGRTVFHHATEGRVDSHWTDSELSRFGTFVGAAALNFAPGRGVAENVRREFGVERRIDPIFTICPDGTGEALDRRRMEFDGSTVRFGILCRMIPEKGIKYLLEALRTYRDRHGDVRFLFAGKGVLEPMIAEFISRHNLLHVEQLSEFASPVEVMTRIDVLVHPSVTDAMPMVIAEALMCGCPCIVTDVGGIPDLVRDGKEGFVIEPGEADRIVGRMEHFAGMTAADFEGYARRARLRYEEVCRPESVGKTVANHYRRALGGNRAES